MWELVAGLFVALAALALILEPVALARGRGATAAASATDDADLEDLTESDSPKIQALLALKEIEFDRATGKIADEDYVRLKARFESDAIAAIKAEEQAAARPPVADRAEAAIRRARERAGTGRRVCPACGPRPEDNAAFCSNCGRSLVAATSAPRCPVCGAGLAEGAKFCPECGGAIAA